MGNEAAVDTIVAISTPTGRGGIGIVRVAGPSAVEIASQLVSPLDLEHAHARFVRVLDPADASRTIDDALITAFLAPHSYTGDDLVEIAAHGSPVVLRALVARALALGARLAGPGEFTQRAFLSGRLDLTQAEAVHDLIAAQTLDQVRVAAQQMGGALSRRVAPAKSSLLHILALLEAGMDFASGELDDVDVVAPAQIAAAIAETRAPLEALAAGFAGGALLRTGAALAVIGRPNAGKSSLFNRLLERDRAIVTPLAGTTRDTVEESLSLGGIPLRLIDTAGLRSADDEAVDEAERQGIERSHEASADADLVLFVHDATTALDTDDRALLEGLTGRPHLFVENKIDLAEKTPAPSATATSPNTTVRTSALTGEGLDELRHEILCALQAEGGLGETAALNNQRQQQAVADTLTALDDAARANTEGLPHEVLLLDLYTALRSLDSLTGATTPDDILGMIFSQFCIGK
jgi:tRNA modification GTPase